MRTFNLLVFFFLVLSTPSFAQSETPRADQRQINQAGRLEKGVAAGRLTEHESARMARGQQHVENVESRAKADGLVTRAEKRRIHQAQEVQSRHIYRQKHDAQNGAP